MRKKKETPSGPKRGRPRNSGLTVPSWAHKAIQGLSDHSGVTSQKILEVALRDGIQLVGAPLGAWVEYQKSSEKLWDEHIKKPAKVDATSPEETGVDTGTPVGIPAYDGGIRTDEDRYNDVDERSGFRPEVHEDHEVIQALSNGE